ncbi:MAG: blue light sensor protein [Hyphomicrobiales bacterium]|jgi:hypothetical protein|nr:blue light sensor protein [Hyphomicrobiales bacterium]
MLVHCLYASRPTAPLAAPLIDTILQKSRKNNVAVGITGALCFTEDVFIQVLEGGRDAVCDLYNTIAQDDRHHHVRLLVYGEISERRFGGWTMGHVDLTRINPGLLLKYSEMPVLNPFLTPGSATMALLDELVSSAAIGSKGA